MHRIRVSRRHVRMIAAAYAASAAAVTVALLCVDAAVAERTGLHREIYPNVDFTGPPLARGLARDITLGFLLDDPALPQRFFSARWRGFWYVPAAGEYQLHGAGDDRLDVWLDGELVIRRTPPGDMHTLTRTVRLDAGVHELRVEYQQHGGARALRLRWSQPGGRDRPLPARQLFPSAPDGDDIRLAKRAAQLERLALGAWSVLIALGVVLGVQRAWRRVRRWSLRWDRGPDPSAEPLSRGGVLVVNAAFVTLSALFCSKIFLLTDLNSHGILGGDPAASNWQLQWVSRALYTDPLRLFDGNTFHPHPNVVALMDHMLTLAVINVPLSLLSDSPWFGYNLLIFLAYYLSCIGGYWFVREVTGSRHAGVWGGIFWAFLFFRIHHIGHLNILSFQGMPFVAASLVRFLRHPTLARTLVFSALFVAQALVSWYLAVITAILVFVVSLVQAGRHRLTLSHVSLFAAAVALCATVILPMTGPYRRSLEETHLGDRYVEALAPGHRVFIADYLVPPLSTIVGQVRQAGPWIWGEQSLYIGYSALMLALVGLLLRGVPKGATWSTPARVTSSWWLATGVCLVVIGFVAAKGFVSSEQSRMPLLYLSELPGLDFIKGLRATQRFSLLIYFGILILSGAGAAAVVARCRTSFTAWVAIGLASLGFLLEVYPYRLPFQPRPYEVSRLDRAIPLLWQDDRTPVVLHLPIHNFLRRNPTPEAVYMLDSTHHWAKVVNGFSGGQPRGFRQSLEALNGLPNERGVAELFTLEVDLVAIHRATPGDRRRALLAYFDTAPWATVYRIGNEHLVRLDRGSFEGVF